LSYRGHKIYPKISTNLLQPSLTI